VNVSARHLREPDVVSAVLSCLARHGVPPSTLAAEVTESLFRRRPSCSRGSDRARLRDVRRLGGAAPHGSAGLTRPSAA
jgi:EAL domain-containing protein (putative c-di-GMP-specific phosphodiesterase class I)